MTGSGHSPNVEYKEEVLKIKSTTLQEISVPK